MRAAFQSRITVCGDIPRTSTVSSTLSPLKNRSSTTCARRGSIRAKAVRASSTAHNSSARSPSEPAAHPAWNSSGAIHRREFVTARSVTLELPLAVHAAMAAGGVAPTRGLSERVRAAREFPAGVAGDGGPRHRWHGGAKQGDGARSIAVEVASKWSAPAVDRERCADSVVDMPVAVGRSSAL